MQNNKTNILILKYCAIGDLVFFIPFLKTIRNTYKDSKITIISYSTVSELIQHLGVVDRIIVSDFPAEKTLFRKLKEFIKFIRSVRSHKPDIVIVGHRNKIFGLIALISGARIRVGFSNVWFLTDTVEYDSTAHEIDRYLELRTPLKISTIERNPLIEARNSDTQSLSEKLKKIDVEEDDNLIVVFPGGGDNILVSMPIKRWDTIGYRELIKKLLREYEIKVLLIGSADDENLCRMIQDGMERVYNCAGMFSFGEIIALGKRCKLVIGSDSGPTHLLAATGTPTISLFGPTDPRLLAPRQQDQVYIWKMIDCSPCYTPATAPKRYYSQGRVFTCWKGTNDCMKLITVDDVWSECKRLLKDRRLERSNDCYSGK